MATFAELVDTLDLLSSDEIQELKRLVEQKWVNIRRKEILEAVKKSRQESDEGTTIVLSSPEEIKGYFSKMMSDED